MRASDASTRQKILLVGPMEAGKSTIANVLAEAVEGPSDIYRPTVGVRIVECDTEVRSSSQKLNVEIWDVSGDLKYQKCWPAIKKDAAGVVLVYNPEKDSQDKEAESWYGWFPRSMGMSPNQVMVLQSLRRSDMPKRMPLPEKLAKVGVSAPHTVPADDLVSVRKHFSTFVETVRQIVLEKQRQEEEDVMKGSN